MATFFGSPPFLFHPITRTTHYFSSSSQTPQPPPSAPSQPQPPSPPQPLTTTSADPPPAAAVSVQVEQQRPSRTTSSKTVDSTDWIASSLTRRFGLGAGLAWAGFLAFGVLSEQIKTRLEVSQQEANTRYMI
ncbi:unnamed protein product [Ilex paraguariensis]|uniref:Uncharacterized protein n=1 Tax=Ilex paraguariensis TaxID=185542 RepID=A0ABC8R4E8_9AQUA